MVVIIKRESNTCALYAGLPSFGGGSNSEVTETIRSGLLIASFQLQYSSRDRERIECESFRVMLAENEQTINIMKKKLRCIKRQVSLFNNCIATRSVQN